MKESKHTPGPRKPYAYRRNARLIAAAPDLLEALERLWPTVVVIPVNWKDPQAQTLCQKCVSAIEQAKRAIAKAEGRQ